MLGAILKLDLKFEVILMIEGIFRNVMSDRNEITIFVYSVQNIPWLPLCQNRSLSQVLFAEEL